MGPRRETDASARRRSFDLDAAIGAVVRAQVAHPWRFLAAGLALTAIAFVFVARLRIDSSYAALLPADSPEMRNLDEVRRLTGGTRQFVVAIGGGTLEQRIAFGREIVPRLERTARVSQVDFEYPVAFFRDRALWLVDDETMGDLVPALERALKLYRERGDPRGVGVAWGRVQGALADSLSVGMGPEGVVTSRDGRYTFLVIRPSIHYWDLDENVRLVDSVRAVVDAAHPERRGLEVRYAGNIQVITENRAVLLDDMAMATVVALVLGVLIVVVFTRGVLGPALISASLAAGIAWTFALAYLLVGHLNVITGFLISTLIGLGINYGIHIYVRYAHDASALGADPAAVLVRSVTALSKPALTSALTTFGAFFSLFISDFRGFSEFGLLAGLGIMLTLASAYALLPPLLVVTRRIQRFRRTVPETLLGRTRIPYALAAAVVVAISAFGIYGAAQVTGIPFHIDYKVLRGRLPSSEFTDYVNANLTGGLNPSVIVVDSVSEAARAQDVLAARAAALEERRGVVGIRRTLSIADVLPRDSEERRGQIARLRAALSDPALDVAVAGDPARTALLAQGRRMLDARPWAIEGVPIEVRRRLVAPDGRHFLVVVWPREENDNDLRTVAWDDELREIGRRLRAAGIEALLADETCITAWIYRMIVRDGPRLLVVASIVVFLFVLLDLRSFRRAVLVSMGLAMGMATFAGCVHLLGWELNLFNLVVVPSLIGIGIDNAVYVYARYRAEGRGSLGLVVRRTGLECFLCSCTNAIGFGSAMVAHNPGLQSMGELAILGITNTFVSAVVFFPCLLTLLEAHARRPSRKLAGAPPLTEP